MDEHLRITIKIFVEGFADYRRQIDITFDSCKPPLEISILTSVSFFLRILVGAPEDEPYPINGVTRPGAVYRCEPGSRGYPSENRPLEKCNVMVFDKNRGKFTTFFL